MKKPFWLFRETTKTYQIFSNIQLGLDISIIMMIFFIIIEHKMLYLFPFPWLFTRGKLRIQNAINIIIGYWVFFIRKSFRSKYNKNCVGVFNNYQNKIFRLSSLYITGHQAIQNSRIYQYKFDNDFLNYKEIM